MTSHHFDDFGSNRAKLGPLDVSELRELRPLHDFGSIRVPNRPDLTIRLEVEQNSSKVIAVSIDVVESNIQVQAFAAPRNEPMWNEVKNSLSSSIKEQGGKFLERDGSFGREILAELPSFSDSGTRLASRHLRFIGIDGPRWLLRVVVSGAALVDPGAAATVDEIIRGIVVNRGDSPLPPRELLTLNVPPGSAASVRG